MGERWAKRLKTYTTDDLATLTVAVGFLDDPVAKMLTQHRICELQAQVPVPPPIAQPEIAQPAARVPAVPLAVATAVVSEDEEEEDEEEEEVWKAVPSMPGYEVSNRGKVKNNGVVRPDRARSFHGYRRVLYAGKYKNIARLVCEAFHGPAPAQRPFCGHINRVRDDDRATNLRWVDASENQLNRA